MAKSKEKVECQYCGKMYSPQGLGSHEAACSDNPENAEPTETPKKKEVKDDIRLGYGNVADKPLKYQVMHAQKRKRELAQYYKTQEKIEVNISPMYKPYFGKSMAVSLNGIPIYVPCDNQRYKIPKSYAMEVAARIARVDAQINRQTRMANVSKNFDGGQLGSLDLIQKV